VLSDAQVTQNFNTEKAGYHYDGSSNYLAKATAQLVKAPIHRYTFNNLASGADGTTITDVAGVGLNQANGLVRGAGATVNGTTGLDLPGGPSASAAYVDLPNGIVSGTFNGGAGYLSATFETWVLVQSNQNWQRIMDFGVTDAGEITGPGGGYNNARSIMVSGSVGTDPNIRFELAGNAVGAGAGSRDAAGNSLGLEMQVTLVYDGPANQWKWYRNGELQESFDSIGGAPSSLNDVNNWLGRSMWSGDANTDAIYDEFRVYDYALSVEEIRGNFAPAPIR
jgi:hypothetical protein